MPSVASLPAIRNAILMRLAGPNARRALTIGGGLGAAGLGASALNSMGSPGGTEETPEAYRQRTSSTVLDPLAWEQMRQQVTDAMRAVSVYAVMPDIDPTKAQLAKDYQPAFSRLREAGSLVRAGDLSAAIEGIEALDPETGASLRSRLNSMLPARDTDIDETAGMGIGGVGGLLAGLALTRGKSPRAMGQALRALGVAGATGAGALGGGVAQNMAQSQLTSSDVGGLIPEAGALAAVGGLAAGGRSGLRRLGRIDAVRNARMALAMPEVDQSLPYFDRIAAEQSALAQARNAAGTPISDVELTAPLLLHMERVMQGAGRPRSLTSMDDVGAISNLLRRQGKSKGAAQAMEGLDAAYRQLLVDLDVQGGGTVPELRMLEPDVPDPAQLAKIEEAITKVTGARKRAEARVKRLSLESVVRDLRELEGKRNLDSVERYAKRLLEQQFVRLKGKAAEQFVEASTPTQIGRQLKKTAGGPVVKGDDLLKLATEAQGKVLSEAEMKRRRALAKQRIDNLKSINAVQREMDKLTVELNKSGLSVDHRALLQGLITDLRARARLVSGVAKRSPVTKSIERAEKKVRRRSKQRNALLALPKPEGS